MSTRTRKKSGFADTKNYPHKRHPAKYRRLDNDDIEYITFTHHDKVEINGETFPTIPLNSNINKEERKHSKKISYVFPKVFIGKRSALGAENKRYDLINKDNIFVNELFNTLPKEKVSYSNKSKKKKQR